MWELKIEEDTLVLLETVRFGKKLLEAIEF